MLPAALRTAGAAALAAQLRVVPTSTLLCESRCSDGEPCLPSKTGDHAAGSRRGAGRMVARARRHRPLPQPTVPSSVTLRPASTTPRRTQPDGPACLRLRCDGPIPSGSPPSVIRVPAQGGPSQHQGGLEPVSTGSLLASQIQVRHVACAFGHEYRPCELPSTHLSVGTGVECSRLSLSGGARPVPALARRLQLKSSERCSGPRKQPRQSISAGS